MLTQFAGKVGSVPRLSRPMRDCSYICGLLFFWGNINTRSFLLLKSYLNVQEVIVLLRSYAHLCFPTP